MDLLAEDPLLDAEPAVPLPALVTRVKARLGEGARGARPRAAALRWGGAAAAAAAGVLAVLAWSALPAPGPGGGSSPERTVAAGTDGEVEVTDDALARLERNLARERAVRYLGDAEAVLLHVTAAPRLCTKRGHGVEMGEETRRSRELLERRALAVSADAPALAPARDLLQDVEGVLREVASLDPCANARELEAIREDIARRRLLLKIELMTRELQG
jgi:hypothetical protein